MLNLATSSILPISLSAQTSSYETQVCLIEDEVEIITFEIIGEQWKLFGEDYVTVVELNDTKTIITAEMLAQFRRDEVQITQDGKTTTYPCYDASIPIMELAALYASESQFSNVPQTQVERQNILLDHQVKALRIQVNELQQLLEAAEQNTAAKLLEIDRLGMQLNTALARVAAESRRRAAIEEQQRLLSSEDN